MVNLAYTDQNLIEITDPKVSKAVSGLVEISGSAILAFGEE